MAKIIKSEVSSGSGEKTHGRKVIKILSIDGGGIRGIIPALILQELESMLKGSKHLTQCFDMMSGTSTGGIIVLLLNTPNARHKPKYWAADVVNLYRDLGPHVFSQSVWQYISRADGWLREKYSAKHLEDKLADFFGHCRLQDALTNIIIPAYDISLDDNIFFKSDRAKTEFSRDFFFKDIARATSAAPTYFKPASIQDIYQEKKYTLIDGGVSLNNPTMSACVHARKLFGRDHDYLIVSIGTGTNKAVAPGKLSFRGKEICWGGRLEWAPDIVDVLMNATNEVVDYQINELFTGDKGFKRYHRFQADLDAQHTAFDNTRSENISALENYAYEIIQSRQDELKEVANLLSQ